MHKHGHACRHRHTRGHSQVMSTHINTQGQTSTDTSAHWYRHTPFLRCSFSWLSSPCAASWWMDRAGARERKSLHLSHPGSVPQRTPSQVALSSATLLPLPHLGDGGHSQSRVAGRAETSFPRCRLVRVVECFRELPAGRETKGLSFPTVYVSEASNQTLGT